jgi:hypothetical protein
MSRFKGSSPSPQKERYPDRLKGDRNVIKIVFKSRTRRLRMIYKMILAIEKTFLCFGEPSGEQRAVRRAAEPSGEAAEPSGEQPSRQARQPSRQASTLYYIFF